MGGVFAVIKETRFSLETITDYQNINNLHGYFQKYDFSRRSVRKSSVLKLNLYSREIYGRRPCELLRLTHFHNSCLIK